MSYNISDADHVDADSKEKESAGKQTHRIKTDLHFCPTQC